MGVREHRRAVTREGTGRETPLLARIHGENVMGTREAISRANLVRYIYTLGVMVTGVFLSQQSGGFDSSLLWVSLFVVALGWVGYYHVVVIPRFEHLDGHKQDVPDHGG